jgi:hypothetical protein
VDRLTTDLMVGMKQRFVQQVSDVATLQSVKHSPIVSPPFDQPGEAKFGEVLAGHSGPSAVSSVQCWPYPPGVPYHTVVR